MGECVDDKKQRLSESITEVIDGVGSDIRAVTTIYDTLADRLHSNLSHRVSFYLYEIGNYPDNWEESLSRAIRLIRSADNDWRIDEIVDRWFEEEYPGICSILTKERLLQYVTQRDIPDKSWSIIERKDKISKYESSLRRGDVSSAVVTEDIAEECLSKFYNLLGSYDQEGGWNLGGIRKDGLVEHFYDNFRDLDPEDREISDLLEKVRRVIRDAEDAKFTQKVNTAVTSIYKAGRRNLYPYLKKAALPAVLFSAFMGAGYLSLSGVAYISTRSSSASRSYISKRFQEEWKERDKEISAKAMKRYKRRSNDKKTDKKDILPRHTIKRPATNNPAEDDKLIEEDDGSIMFNFGDDTVNSSEDGTDRDEERQDTPAIEKPRDIDELIDRFHSSPSGYMLSELEDVYGDTGDERLAAVISSYYIKMGNLRKALGVLKGKNFRSANPLINLAETYRRKHKYEDSFEMLLKAEGRDLLDDVREYTEVPNSDSCDKKDVEFCWLLSEVLSKNKEASASNYRNAVIRYLRRVPGVSLDKGVVNYHYRHSYGGVSLTARYSCELGTGCDPFYLSGHKPDYKKLLDKYLRRVVDTRDPHEIRAILEVNGPNSHLRTPELSLEDLPEIPYAHKRARVTLSITR